MEKKFREYNSQLSLGDVNKEVLADWDRHSLFERSMKEREGNPTFVFYEGPPSANGMPGIHHVMARTIKDIFCRYKTMKGFHVKRPVGTLMVSPWSWAWRKPSASPRRISARRFP